MTALFIPVSTNSEQKEQTNKEKYVFYCSVWQIHINPDKKHEKNTRPKHRDSTTYNLLL